MNIEEFQKEIKAFYKRVEQYQAETKGWRMVIGDNEYIPDDYCNDLLSCLEDFEHMVERIEAEND